MVMEVLQVLKFPVSPFYAMKHILKVSETQFSLTASYILAFLWYDKRVSFKETPQATTHVLDYGLLNKIWSPKLKVCKAQPPCEIPFKFRFVMLNEAVVTVALVTTRSLLALLRWKESL